jgi:hypothetical protein
MLKAMASFIRPAPDRRPMRHTRSRSPPPAEVARTAHHQQQPSPPVAARRLSKTLPVPSQAAAHSNATVATPTDPPSPARSSARKRSFAEVDTPEARPPFKVKQRRSDDHFLSPSNGATKLPDSIVDNIRSGTSTPKPGDAAQTPSAATDKKSLRSGDPSGRRATQLAEIFEDYEVTIANWEDAEPTDSSTYQVVEGREPEN